MEQRREIVIGYIVNAHSVADGIARDNIGVTVAIGNHRICTRRRARGLCGGRPCCRTALRKILRQVILRFPAAQCCGVLPNRSNHVVFCVGLGADCLAGIILRLSQGACFLQIGLHQRARLRVPVVIVFHSLLVQPGQLLKAFCVTVAPIQRGFLASEHR